MCHSWCGSAGARPSGVNRAMGKQCTKAEQEADEGTSKLVQCNPLPQTIYHVRAKRGRCVLVAIPLQIAP